MMSSFSGKLARIEKVTNSIQSKKESISKCIPIVVDPNYIPQYNEKGELLPPPILGGLSSTTTPRE